MIARRAEIAVLAIGLIIIVLLAFERERVQRASAPSTFSTYDTGPNGYRALYGVLLAASVPVRRFQRPLGALDADVRTIVISSYLDDPNARWLGRHDTDTLKRFVSGGGRLVALDTDFAGRGDVVPGVGESTTVRSSSGAPALARSRYTAGVRSVAAPIDAVFPVKSRRGVALLGNAHGAVAVAYALGKGEVIAITAPALFSNAWLRNRDNLAFAYNTIARHGPAAFDEYVHGYDDDLSFWQVLPAPFRAAFWVVCAIVVLALIGANVRFAPPVPVETETERDSAAYVAAMATLMQRARASGTLIARFAGDAARMARDRDDPALRAELAELRQLGDLPRPSDGVLVRAAAIAYRVRKEGG